MEQRGEGEVRVAGGVWRAQLAARGLLLAAGVCRHADERRPVAPAPRDVHRRLVARHQTLVRVDPLREHARQLACVAQLPGDERLGVGREQVLVGGVEERVAVAPEEALVRVHARPVLARQRLGHEGGVDAVAVRNLLHHRAVGHDVVGHGEGVVVPHVDLVLAGCHLVVRELHVNAHGLERQHGLTAQVACGVERGEVEVATAVERLGALGVLEVEELKLGAEVIVVVPHRLGALHGAAQDLPGVAFVRLAGGQLDVAEHPCHALHLGAVGQHLEGVGVGHGHHVRLLDGVEAGDGGAVKAHAVRHGIGQLLARDGEALELPEDVREPEAHELDVALFHERQNLFASHMPNLTGVIEKTTRGARRRPE